MRPDPGPGRASDLTHLTATQTIGLWLVSGVGFVTAFVGIVKAIDWCTAHGYSPNWWAIAFGLFFVGAIMLRFGGHKP